VKSYLIRFGAIRRAGVRTQYASRQTVGRLFGRAPSFELASMSNPVRNASSLAAIASFGAPRTYSRLEGAFLTELRICFKGNHCRHAAGALAIQYVWRLSAKKSLRCRRSGYRNFSKAFVHRLLFRSREEESTAGASGVAMYA
jgi:hypothetical protein